MQKFYLKYLLSIVFLLVGIFGFAQSPQASFTMSANQGCSPFSIQFNNTSTDAVSYQWNFGNGNSSTLTNPANVYTAPGIYTVTLTATSSNGQTHTVTQTNSITIFGNPVADFTVNATQGCRFQTAFQFTSTSTNAVSYFWDFGDGTFSTLANPTKIYGSTGTYNVSLLVTNSTGCTNVKVNQNFITVHGLPNPQFSATPTVSCDVNQSFQFTPSVSSGLSYLWDFGDGTTSTQANPSKVYGQHGIFTVKLKVTNANGCIDSLIRPNYITIHTPVNPTFTANNIAACPPLNTSFTSLITNATNYSWNLGNNQTSNNVNASTTYLNPGAYDVSLTVTMSNGCSYTNAQTNFITVHPQPIPNFTLTNPTGCAPHTVTIDNQSTGWTSMTYHFDSNQNVDAPFPTIQHTYNNPGDYSVYLRLANQFGCFRITYLSGTVTGLVADFTADVNNGCPPFNVNFTNNTINSSNATFLWDFGDGNTSTSPNPQHTYTQNGSYEVTLTTTNPDGCVSTKTIPNFINVSYTTANYTPPPALNGCAPFTSSFNMSNPLASSYLWDFGDGNTSTEQNPTHVYNQGGTYNVSLLVGQQTGCSLFYPIFQTINISSDLPAFTVNINPCPPYEVQFSDNSTNAISWLWNFGDGTTSTLQNPTHTYSEQQNQNVTLTVTTSGGCSYSYIGYNAVNFSAMQANWSSAYTTGPFPQTVQFSSLNSAATSWQWDFGDGTTSTEQNPTHIYLTEGDYVVTLTITVGSCTITTEGSPFTMNPAFDEPGIAEQGGPGNYYPPDEIPPLVGCASLNVTFYKQSPLHNVIQWNFGDGNTSNQQNPQHTFTNAGYYIVSYQAQTPTGLQTINYPQAIRVGRPVASFSLDQNLLCTQSLFTLQALTNPAIQSYAWLFSNGATATSPDITVTLPSSNSAYTVSLTVTDTLGCISTNSQSLYTLPPIPAISYQTQVCKTPVTFSHTMPSTFQFVWNFGDGTTSTLATPSHQYQNSGTYFPTVQINTSNGCVYNPQLAPIQFYNPVANFVINGPNERCIPATYVFTPTGSSGGNGSAQNPNGYVWESPPNYATYSDSVVYNINQIATILIRLRVVNNGMPNCSSVTDYDTIRTYQAQANFSANQASLCLPTSVQFTDLSVQAVSWLWDFGDGNTSTLQNPTHTFTSLPTDSVSLTITDIRGCTRTVKKPNIQQFSAVMSASQTTGCNPFTVNFACSTPGVASYQWDFGDGTTSTSNNPSHTYTINGNYSISLIVVSIEGCSDTITMPNYISVMGPQAAFNSPTPAGCAPSVVEFFDQSVGASSWYWDFGDNTFSYIQNPSKIYAWPGQYTVTLTITASNGCSTTISYPNYITVLGPGTTFTASSISACENNPIQFTESSQGAVSWEWNFGDGSVSTAQYPTHQYSQSGNYTVTVFTEDTIGCTAFYMLPTSVSIHGFPTAQIGLDMDSGCTPHTVQFSNTTLGNNTFLWNFGNGSSAIDSLPSHTFTTAGNYTVNMIATNEHGCADTSNVLQVWAKLVPDAQFTISETSGCTPLLVQFNNETTNTENPSYLWNFGNGETSTLVSPSNEFLNPGTYSVSLAVNNSNGCSDTLVMPSLVEVFDTIPPPISELVRVTVVNETTVNIFWMQNSANDFQRYELYRQNINSGIFELVQTFGDIHLTSFSDQNLNTLSQSYCYKIKTVDRCGYALPIEMANEHCTIDITAQTQSNNTIDVHWSPYVGKQVTNYVIFRREENATNTETVATVPGHITSIIDSTVICPVKYRYSVQAKALDGLFHLDSDSDYDDIEPIENLFTDQKVDAARSTVVQNKFVLTEWATPTIMGQYVTGYKVLRSTDEVNFEQIAVVPAFQNTYIDENVDVNTTKYFYQIMSINVCLIDGKEGIKSDNIVLKAKADEAWGINLEWTPYLNWTSGVAFYIVEKLDENGQWKVIKQVNGSVTNTVDEN